MAKKQLSVSVKPETLAYIDDERRCWNCTRSEFIDLMAAALEIDREERRVKGIEMLRKAIQEVIK